jgi:hypothetical protein
MGRMNVSAEILHDVLTQEIRKLNTGADWARWLNTAALFPTYGFGNAVLISLQMPHANFIAGAPSWERLGRRVVKSGAIKILAPVRSRVLFESQDGASTMDPQGSIQRGVIGFNVANVWDVAHTVGPKIALPPIASGDVDALWQTLREDSRENGFSVDIRFTGTRDSYTDHAARRIVLSGQLDSITVVSRLAHELAHVRMHSAARGRRVGSCHGVAEIEADSFAHIVLAHYGLATATSSFDKVLNRATALEPRSPESAIKAIGTRAVIAARRFLEDTDHDVSPMPRTVGKVLGQDAHWHTTYPQPEL